MLEYICAKIRLERWASNWKKEVSQRVQNLVGACQKTVR